MTCSPTTSSPPPWTWPWWTWRWPTSPPLALVGTSTSIHQVQCCCTGVSHLRWEKPWLPLEGKDMQFNYQRMEDPSLHTGRLLNMGDYPNEVRYYAPFLPAIRRMFTFQPRFSGRAQSQLRGELARRGLGSEEVTWVGVHNRRSSGAPLITKNVALLLFAAKISMNQFCKYEEGLCPGLTTGTTWPRVTVCSWWRLTTSGAPWPPSARPTPTPAPPSSSSW